MLSDEETPQDLLARKTNIAASAICGYVHGETEPKITALVKIAEHFNVSTDYLLGRTDIKSVDEDIQSAVNYSGLSEDAVQKVHDFAQDTNNRLKISIMNHLLKNGFLFLFIGLIEQDMVMQSLYNRIQNRNDDENLKVPVFEEIKRSFQTFISENYNTMIEELHDNLKKDEVAIVEKDRIVEVIRRANETAERIADFQAKSNKILEQIDAVPFSQWENDCK